jgi:sugar (pentulose or hexulose) kinase
LEPSAAVASRRRLFAGAGALGALAAAAAVMPSLEAPAEAVQAAAPPQPDASAKGGYQLTEHVRRYYQTARV